MAKEMEIECPHCHATITPKGRFSAAAFAVLLALGVLPFVLSIISLASLLDALRLLMEMPPPNVPTPVPIEIPPEITALGVRVAASMGLLAASYLILSLVVGLVPAVVYLAVRRGSYKCPACDLPIG
ncbi:TPA: hypothetical protein EYP44_04645 [Candidatus Bathyarchaeota archaeon]|nr:hypothetical protein [Candidatus Bathyarchaeota archaeon]